MNLNDTSTTGMDACCTSCSSFAADTAPPVACSLDSGDFSARIARIRALATRSLRTSERSPLTMRLTYDADARREVEELVAAESECCAFLGFDLKTDQFGVHLTITAPEDAAPAANELFAHFAPDMARETA